MSVAAFHFNLSFDKDDDDDDDVIFVYLSLDKRCVFASRDGEKFFVAVARLSSGFSVRLLSLFAALSN